MRKIRGYKNFKFKVYHKKTGEIHNQVMPVPKSWKKPLRHGLKKIIVI